MPDEDQISTLDRETILGAPRRLSDGLASQGITGEICLFEGTVMVLSFSARVATKDVDAIVESPAAFRSRNLFVSQNALSRA